MKYFLFIPGVICCLTAVSCFAQSATGTSALNASLEGYIVYRNDTLDGIVTMTKNNVFLEQAADTNHKYKYHFRYADKNLKCAVVYYDDDELFMIRVANNDNKLSRAVHIGKLSIFDDLYSFDYSVTDEAKLKLVYDGKIHAPGAFVVLDMKLKLVNIVNKVYGTKLDPQKFNTTQNVIDYINKRHPAY